LATADTWLQNPNLSAGSTSAKYVFTGGSGSPYQIYTSGETLPLGGMGKELAAAEEEPLRTLPCAQRCHRAAMVADTAGACLLWVQWGEVAVKTRKGERVAVAFVPWSEGEGGQLTQETAFGYLTSAPLRLAEDADTLAWEYEFYGRGLEGLAGKESGELAVEIRVNETKTGRPLGVVDRSLFSTEAGESRVKGKGAVDISAYRGMEVSLGVRPVGLAGSAGGTTVSVAEVFIIENPFLEGGAPKEQPKLADEGSVPQAFSLQQNYPNPFNPSTEIRYQLPRECRVRVVIYNLVGQEVVRLVDEVQAAGRHAVRWSGEDGRGGDVASGVYVCRLEAGGFVAQRKMVLIR
jgi:hypothetical protein